MFLIVFLSFNLCHAQSDNYTKTIKDFTFSRHFMELKKDDSVNYYSLLANGLVHVPNRNDEMQAIENWLKKHSNAIVKPIIMWEYLDSNHQVTQRRMECLIIDGKDTLNNYLVAIGCFPLNAFSQASYEHLNDWMKALHLKGKERVQLLISNEAYDKYAKRLSYLNNNAQKMQLGMYKPLVID